MPAQPGPGSADAATPRPWSLGEREGPYVFIDGPVDSRGISAWRQLATVPVKLEGKPEPEGEANAALIVRAVNAHDDLVAALREAEDHISAEHENLTTGEADDPGTAEVLAQIRAALAQAQESGK